MIKSTIIALTCLTYGANFLLYLFLKFGKKERTILEKGSMFLAANMSLILIDGIIAIIAKIVEDAPFSLHLLNDYEQNFCLFM